MGRSRFLHIPQMELALLGPLQRAGVGKPVDDGKELVGMPAYTSREALWGIAVATRAWKGNGQDSRLRRHLDVGLTFGPVPTPFQHYVIRA